MSGAAAARLAEAPAQALAPEPDRFGKVLSLTRGRFHAIAYTDWGDERAERAAICVHGLSRQSRDFDPLASRLARLGYRAICPDLPGRGRSDRLADADDYALPQYTADMTALIARVNRAQVDWIGTSLGGLVGIVLAGMPGSPIRRLVINDIGPYLPLMALRRIGDAVRRAPGVFPDIASAEAWYREALSPYGALTAGQWAHITRHSLIEEEGGWRQHHDPAIASVFSFGWVYNLNLWRYWDQIRCPVLVLRGEFSDLLLPGVAAEMAGRGPGAELVEVPGVGHCPALLDEGQIGIITDWLARTG